MWPQKALTSYWEKYSPTLSNLILIVLDHMIQEHNLGATFYRTNLLQSKISQEGSIGRDG